MTTILPISYDLSQFHPHPTSSTSPSFVQIMEFVPNEHYWPQPTTGSVQSLKMAMLMWQLPVPIPDRDHVSPTSDHMEWMLHVLAVNWPEDFGLPPTCSEDLVEKQRLVGRSKFLKYVVERYESESVFIVQHRQSRNQDDPDIKILAPTEEILGWMSEDYAKIYPEFPALECVKLCSCGAWCKSRICHVKCCCLAVVPNGKMCHRRCSICGGPIPKLTNLILKGLNDKCTKCIAKHEASERRRNNKVLRQQRIDKFIDNATDKATSEVNIMWSSIDKVAAICPDVARFSALCSEYGLRELLTMKHVQKEISDVLPSATKRNYPSSRAKRNHSTSTSSGNGQTGN